MHAALLSISITTLGFAQPAPAAAGSVFVDESGVLRWSGNRSEVTQFGVNYTAPFAYAFRAHRRLGVPIERAIDADVYHFARLGFDLYRVHIWDREITDAEGNLLANEHVQAFDYLLARLKQRGIKILLTPLQFGDAGYPEPGVPLPGFSSKYDKRGCLEDRTSWPLQARYLAQLLNHVNPHTGIAYKNDPDILGYEICNEPGHFEYEPTLAYINTMVAALRSTGCRQPIFYNMSHGLPVYRAYLDADVQGGTFQWYPTNLLAGHEQRGNFLPYVDRYPIPFGDDPKFQSKAKMVYEFDAADIGRAYIYPAIARTFRTAGFQLAAQFAYDPLYLAPTNTEYQTHYLNLAYSPQKALGMKIAAETFRRVPRGQDYGSFPANTKFADVRVSYEEDLAELVTPTEFYHSNPTPTRPPQPQRLEHIAGFGNSAVVSYPGAGAYFLDRLEPGVWRLEVMPDAIWVRDPFEKASPRKTIARIAWNKWPIAIRLPDLGGGYSVTGLNDGNAVHGQANATETIVGPGCYLLTRDGVRSEWNRDSRWQNLTLKEFVAPPASMEAPCLLHEPAVEASVGRDLQLTATIAAPSPVQRVELVAQLPDDPAPPSTRPATPARPQPGGGNKPPAVEHFPFEHLGGLQYRLSIPGERLRAGTLRYYVVVTDAQGSHTFPSGLSGQPLDWDFHGQPWQTQLVPAAAPILLFNAQSDTDALTGDHRQMSYRLVRSDRPGLRALAMRVDDLLEPEHDSSLRYYFRSKLVPRADRLDRTEWLVLYGRSGSGEPCPVQLSLVTADGFAYGAIVEVSPQSGAYRVRLSDLKPVRSPNIPHGYPVFIPFWSPAAERPGFSIQRAEGVLVSIGPGIPPDQYGRPHEIEIERIWLE